MSLKPNSRAELRRKYYKMGGDAENARRKREDNLLEIRKNKKDDNLLKKRRQGVQGAQQCTVGSKIVIDNQVLPYLVPILANNPKKNIKKEACWMISNIVAGHKEQIQAVIDANIIPPLVSLLQTAEFDIKKEAAWAIANATSGGSHEQIMFLVDQGCIKPLCDLLDCRDPDLVNLCLEGLENILKVGEAEKEIGSTAGINLYAQYIDDAGGIEKIENLQIYNNDENYAKAVHILETYWEKDDENYYVIEDERENYRHFAANGTDDLPTFNSGANQSQNLPSGFTFG